jgi:hypothetical protein
MLMNEMAKTSDSEQFYAINKVGGSWSSSCKSFSYRIQIFS